MKTSVLSVFTLAILLIGSARAGQTTSEATYGNCSSNMSNNSGSINIVCNGLDPTVAAEITDLVKQISLLNKKMATEKNQQLMINMLKDMKSSLEAARAGQRTLSDWQRTRIKAALLPYTGSYIAIVASEGRETYSYAMQFVDLFKEMHWNVIGPLPAPADQEFSDLQISINNSPPGTYGILPPALSALRGIFQDAQLKMRPDNVLDENVSSGVVVLCIGGQSADNVWSGRYPPVEIKQKITPEMFPTNNHK